MKKRRWIFVVMAMVFLVSLSADLWALHQIMPWRDNKAGAVSLTFDDNNPIHLSFAIPGVESRGFKGTFFLVTSGVWDWAPWVAAASSGHELGSHAVTHSDLTLLPVNQAKAEIDSSKAAIESALGGDKCVSFAYPYGTSNDTIKGLVQSAGYISARGVGCALNGPPYDFYNLHSCYPELGITLDQMKGYTDMAAQQGKWLVTLFHYFDGWYGSWLEPDFIAYLDYLHGKNVWVAPAGSVAKYIHEREAASVYLVYETADEIELELTASALDPAAYDEPLTIRSQVPSHWTKVKVHQGWVETTVVPVNEGGSTVIYYDAVPNDGLIVLTNAGFPAPVIAYIQPSWAKASTSGFYMMVYGSGFTRTSIVRMGQMQRRTTYVSPTQLRAWIMPSDLSKPRVWTITVIDHAQGGVVSNGVTFTVR